MQEASELVQNNSNATFSVDLGLENQDRNSVGQFQIKVDETHLANNLSSNAVSSSAEKTDHAKSPKMNQCSNMQRLPLSSAYRVSNFHRHKSIGKQVCNNFNNLLPDGHISQGRFSIGKPSGCFSPISDESGDENCGIFAVEKHLTMKTNNANSSSQQFFKQSRQLRFMDHDELYKTCMNTQTVSVIVKINVSGTVFHVKHNTLQRDPFVFGKLLEDAIWIEENKEYYFERDPEVFRFIHNYLRHGELHLPPGMCGPIVEKELDEWGLPLGLDIQRCCLGPVMESKSKLESLEKFEANFHTHSVQPNNWIKSESWCRLRDCVWSVLDREPRQLPVTCSLTQISNTLFDYKDNIDLASSLLEIQPPSGKIKDTAPSVETSCGADNSLQNMMNDQLNWIRLNKNNHHDDTGDNSLTSNVDLSNLYIQDNLKRHPFSPRRLYLIYETGVTLSAVIVFVLCTMSEFRRTISTDKMQFWFNDLALSTRVSTVNDTKILTLPVTELIYMDMSLSILITLDIIIRMIFCPNLFSWLTSISTVIDIFSVLSFYNESIIHTILSYNVLEISNASVMALLNFQVYTGFMRVFIILRLIGILLRHRSTYVLFYTIYTTLNDLSLIMILIFGGAFFFGAVIYFVDTNFANIPRGVWWALVTMTTVGYGDIVPQSTVGYMIAVACIIIGTLLVSYTIPVLVNHFLLYHSHADQLYRLKQLRQSAKRKLHNRKMTHYLQNALYNLKQQERHKKL